MRFKSFLTVSFIAGLMACNNVSLEEIEKEYLSEVSIPVGGNTYVTSGHEGAKISRRSGAVEDWTNEEAVLSTYFKLPQAEKALLQLVLDSRESSSELQVTVGENIQTIALEAGAEDTVSVGLFELPSGYAQVDVQGLSKAGAAFPSLKSLIVRTKNDLEITYVKDNESNRFYWGRRGPSVHLSYTLPKEKDFKWFYNEVTVPEGEDPNGSYYMANGFGEGYFGMQANSDDERRVLFSVWSPFHTNNPDEIPEDQQIKLLKKGEGVNTGEFGNEGSGGQSFFRYKWITGNTYKFLNSVEPDGNGNTIYTAYFFAPEVGEWKLIASFLRPKTDTWYKRPHSFLENFRDSNGYIGRKGLYANQWAMDTEGNWIELTEAKFTGDDIARRGYRQDFAGGEENGVFFMRNGGFFNEMVDLNSMHTREATGNQPEIDFSSLD
ncbi:DUF3472 domain-containing protein [Echinicola salinicaeni]|uniref:DUF3472 domain-containing protein n=1 Tax=Echinicola salinicaeni TaxID=2762757 RepID=UPI0016462510|nr:DUF3472 domain-containing protein [Echinicola salinicaeni]